MSGNADIYHEMIIDYSRHPTNYETEDQRKLEDSFFKNTDVIFHDSNPLCGDSIDIGMKIDDNKVTDIKFSGKGCAICMACTSVLTEIAKGKSLDDVRKIEKNDILSELGLEQLQAVRIKCALLSLKVLKSALYTYLAKHLDDSQDVDKLKEDAASLY